MHFGFTFDNNGFILHKKVSTNHQHDSIEATPAPNLKEGFIKSLLHKKILSLNELNLPGTQLNSLWFRTYVGTFPKAFFVLLPLFAFLLRLVYRKHWYVDHLIFSIHFYVFSFIVIITLLSLMSFVPFFDNNYTSIVMLIILLVYLYIALQKVYHSNVGITLLKGIFVTSLYALFLFLTLILLLIITILLI